MAIDLGTLDLRDALDLAVLMEEEARERYQSFTRIVGGRSAGDAADVFKLMVGYETKHGEQLAARRAVLFKDAPRRVQIEMLDDVEAPDRSAPRTFMSAHDAMTVAIASEEKARDFFAEALKQVKDPAVRALFTDLQAEEESHRKLLVERLARLPPGPDLTEADADEPGSDGG
jgi:rubrerythrin